MAGPFIPPDGTLAQLEREWIDALRRFDLLGQTNRDALDRIARLAALALGCPAAGVSLVDATRIRFEGSHGVPVDGLPRNDDSFCHHVVMGRDILVVDDTLTDERFRDHPLVADGGSLPEGPVRFYAGYPVTVRGHALGSVWVVDLQPRTGLAEHERTSLEDLGELAARELENGLAHRHLSDVFTHAQDAIFTLSDTGEFLSLNPAFERVTGHDRANWLGQHFGGLIHSDDMAVAQNAFVETLNGEEVRLELRVIDSEGEVRPLDVMAVPRRADGKTVQVFGFARDIRERERAEARLQEQAELLAERQEKVTRMARASNDALWEFDFHTQLVWWSEGMGKLFGYQEETQIASPDRWEERIHPDDRERVLAKHHRALENQDSQWDDEFRYRRADGTYAYVYDRAFIEYDEDGNPVQMYGGVVDITQRKEAELALQRNEELFRNLFARAPIGIYRTTPEGEILLANDAIVRMLGFDSFEELKERDLETEGYDEAHPRSEFRDRLDHQDAVEGFEAVWRRRDGSTLVVREHARAVRDEDGNIVYYEGTVEDVTEQRRFQDALQRLVEMPATIDESGLDPLAKALAEALDARWALFVRPFVDDQVEVVASHGTGLPDQLPTFAPLVHAMQGSAVEILAGLPFHAENGDEFAELVPAKSLLAMPVRNPQGEVIGALAVLDDRPIARPSPSDRWLLTAFAQRAGIEIEQQEYLGRLEATARAADVLRTAESVQEVYRRATDEVLATTSAESVNVYVYDEAQNVLRVHYSAGLAAEDTLDRTLARGQGITWRVLDSGASLFIPDLRTEPNVVFFGGGPRPGAFAGAPLIDPYGHVFGALAADTVGRGSTRKLSRLDLYYIEAMAQAIGVSVARLEALARAQRESERFRGLAELSARLEIMDDPLEIARSALRALLPLTGFTLGSMWTVEGRRLNRVISVGPASDRVEQVFVSRDLTQERGVLAEVVDRKETIWIPEYAESPYALPDYVAAGLRSLVATPLIREGAVYGALVLDTFDKTMQLSDETRSLLQAVAHRVQRALQRASSRQELVTTREEALRALGLALEYRDYETKGHTDRVTDLALGLGNCLGLSEVQLKHLRWGAYLHDTGKVSIPDHILLKPGKLDPAEWRRMREHVTIGEAMLRELGFIPEDVLDIVRHHHERYDGDGYPDGRKGEDIPLLARLFSVVDVYDALISERPYKEAWLPHEALAEIEANAGTQFDADVARTFVEMMRGTGDL